MESKMEACCRTNFADNSKMIKFCNSCGKTNPKYVDGRLNLDLNILEYTGEKKFIIEEHSYGSRNLYISSQKYADKWLNSETFEEVRGDVLEYMENFSFSNIKFKQMNKSYQNQPFYILPNEKIREIIMFAGIKKFTDLILSRVHIKKGRYYSNIGDYIEVVLFAKKAYYRYIRDGHQNIQVTDASHNNYHCAKFNDYDKIEEEFIDLMKRFAGKYYLDIRNAAEPHLYTYDELVAEMHPFIRDRFNINLQNKPADVILSNVGIEIVTLAEDYAALCEISQFFTKVESPIKTLLLTNYLSPKPPSEIVDNYRPDLIAELIALYAKK